jgi:hypothetical protein
MTNSPDFPQGDSVEESIVGWCRQLLKNAEFTSADNFIDSGGHSLLAVHLADLVRSSYAVELDLRTLFDHDIASVAVDLDSKRVRTST